jgi:hypothetical protein
MADIPSHHYIYGTCIDYITGETIVDTDDERCRQDLAKFLVERRGMPKTSWNHGCALKHCIMASL